MNFLAHLYLSGEDHELLIGNFIADSVKGAAHKNYPEGIKRGILLHRAIDNYTDQHPVFRESVKRIRNKHGKFSGVIADIFYDHFLASNWKDFSNEPLTEYVDKVHQIILGQKSIMPEKSQRFLKYMLQYNWLLSYASTEGISRVLYGMSKRTSYENNMDTSVFTLKEFYSEFENEFRLFFPDIKNFVAGDLG